MYSQLTPETARKQSSAFLVQTLNECRPDSGAYLVAKSELDHRAAKRGHVQKAAFAVVVAILGAIGLLLK
jgi:hypothetical protein